MALLVLDPLKIIVIRIIINTHEQQLLTMSQCVKSDLDDSQRQWVLVVLIKLNTVIGKVDQHHLIVSIHDISTPITMDITQLELLNGRLKVITGFDWIDGCGRLNTSEKQTNQLNYGSLFTHEMSITHLSTC